MRLAAGVAAVLVVLVSAVLLVGRFWLGSHLDEFRPRIEAALSRQVAVHAHIGHLSAEWHGLLPEFILRDVRLQDARGEVDLSLEWIRARLATLPLLTGRVDFARLEIDHPVVRVQRRADGRVVVAGILLPTPSEEPGSPFLDWLLAQREVRINDGRLEWQDDLAAGRVLTLPKLQLRLLGNGRRHQFELSAGAPVELARGLKVTGTLDADDSSHLEKWSGLVDARADFLDVAQLRDYLRAPVDWRSGRGGIELAVRFSAAQVQAVQADARLDAVALTLADNLPELRFDRLSGHLGFQRVAGGFSLTARQLLAQGALADGAPQVRPADVDLRIDAAGGSARADVANLGALAALAESLPLPPDLRAVVRSRAPTGLLQGLSADWQGSLGRLGTFKVRARMTDLGIAAADGQPGVRHLSGSLQADQSGGTLAIDAKDPVVSLPEVFPQPITLRQLLLAAHWTRRATTADVTIDRLHLDDSDLVGDLTGTLRIVGGKPRQSRLNGLFDRIEVPAVPRFLPLVVSPDARAWLATALRAGHAHQVRLDLQGDLHEFPFVRPGSGTFQVHVPVEGARLDYASGWPALTAIRGTVDFDGPAMTVRVSEAHEDRLVARDVVARVADLDAAQPTLAVHGQVSGPLQSGLDFIQQTPLRRALGAFAGTFQASGDGSVALTLAIPLSRVDDTTVDGLLDVESASLRDPKGEIPPIAGLRGRLHFTDRIVAAEGLNAKVLGGQAQAALKSAPNGDVLLDVHGQLDGLEVDRQFTHGRLDFVRGDGDWDGHFRFGNTTSTLDIVGHLPVYGATAEVKVRQRDGPLTLTAHGAPPCARVVREYVPFLAPEAEGALEWEVSVRHDRTTDLISGSGSCRMFGRPAQMTLAGAAEAFTVDIGGGIDGAALQDLAPAMPAGILSGSTRWDVHVDQRPGQPLVRILSDLRGLRIDVPPPFGKAAADTMPIRAAIGRLRGTTELYLSGGVDGVLGFAGLIPTTADESLHRLAVHIGGAAVLPSSEGISVNGTLAKVDVAAWRSALGGTAPALAARPAGASAKSAAPASGVAGLAQLPLSADLQIEQTISGRYRFEGHRWQLHRQGSAWHVQAHGPQIEGEADWSAEGSGRLTARLDRLILGGDAGAAGSAPPTDGKAGRSLPVVDVDVRDFQLDRHPYGHLELRGEPEPEGWHITRLALSREQGSLSAEGHWVDRPGRSRTRLNAQIDATDTGALLQALGYGKVLSRAKTRLSASLDWPGDPEDFATARLGGSLDLDSQAGQFLTLEPGVGRLLGLLSLQALPRRVTLDFRDIFSQGFAFDAIKGHFDIDRGTMQTQNLEMSGPAAQVKLAGKVGLATETQDLDVRVQPAIGDSISIATTAIAGPLVGAGAWLVQKILSNPFDKILTYEYHVSGSWDDPQVVRVARLAPTTPSGQNDGAKGEHP